MKNILIVVIFSILLFAEPAKLNSVKKLMQVNGEEKNAKVMMIQMINNVLPALKQIAPNSPESFWENVKKNVDDKGFVKSLIPIYQKYLSEKDIQNLIKFYNTPTGKKLVKVNPMIFQDSYIIGHEWGKIYGKKIMQDYKKLYVK